eukprot:gnl/TRDRNA2_/TRDRNA2_178762_c0_seq1.p1 gnl/TRDRNA2_/TRDRNA2_178762_c0~~gnl/TRDRNA2_/TRDRNA2_178762_c0_seq1.p1  ORF type:complete len:426 (+),score=82.21 gnl/TRDRNA2_/TRDRNA2_178762_c0_seq1:172-1278(+)
MAFAGDALELDYYSKCDCAFLDEENWNTGLIHTTSFHEEPNDVNRGVTIAASDLISFTKSDQKWDWPACGLRQIDVQGLTNSAAKIERFHASDEPPVAPDDEFFELQTSTCFLVSTCPAEIGNHLLEFLETQTISNVTKITRGKFAIKAEVFVDYSSRCFLKARVYRQHGRYAVEFQRRSGSQATFNEVYKRAQEFLHRRYESAARGEDDSVFKGLAQDSREDDFKTLDMPAEVDWTPLLEMASMGTQPSLQAEAVVALADAAKDDEVSALLCTSHAFEEVALSLLESDRMDISYPTACLLLAIASCPEAEAAFANSAIKPRIQQKVQSVATNKQVQHLLMQVLNLRGTSCSYELLEKAVPEPVVACP